MPLERRVAIVTGASRGIGAAIARQLSQMGLDLVLVAREEEALEALATEFRADGRAAAIVATDLADPPVAERIVDEALAEFGRLDVLVNNAGGAAPTPFLETTPEQLESAFRLNVVAAFELTRRATPCLLESDVAAVVNVSSRMDRLVARGLLTYGTVKAALSHMTRLLAVELAPRVRVNGIAPGVVATKGLEAALPPEARRQIEAATPLHRLASVEDVAATAGWLVSPDSGYVTGKILDLDGGAEWPVFPTDTGDLGRGDPRLDRRAGSGR